MTLIATEANVEVRNLLIDNWSGNSVTVSETFDTAWISTGWWDEEAPHAQITLTIRSEDTSPDAMHMGASGLSSWVDGIIDCNVWVPYDRENYASQGVAKNFRWDLTRKVHSIIENNQEGTTDSNNDPVLTRLDTGDLQRNPAEDPPPFRMLIPIGSEYRTAP